MILQLIIVTLAIASAANAVELKYAVCRDMPPGNATGNNTIDQEFYVMLEDSTCFRLNYAAGMSQLESSLCTQLVESLDCSNFVIDTKGKDELEPQSYIYFAIGVAGLLTASLIGIIGVSKFMRKARARVAKQPES
jgi:hypothetical protein